MKGKAYHVTYNSEIGKQHVILNGQVVAYAGTKDVAILLGKIIAKRNKPVN